MFVQVLLDLLVQLDRLETLALLVRLEQLVLREWKARVEVQAFQVCLENEVYQGGQVLVDFQASAAGLDQWVFQGSLVKQVPLAHQGLAVLQVQLEPLAQLEDLE